jgi:hypothetical protein
MMTQMRFSWTILLCLTFSYAPSPAAPAKFSIATFKRLIKKRIKWTGARDTISARVAKGESCVEAAHARAREIASVVKSMQVRKTFAGYGARVGTVSGWNPGIGSMHTYSVVEVLDGKGMVLHTLDADNYMGVIYVSNHGSINWKLNNTYLVETVTPLPPDTPEVPDAPDAPEDATLKESRKQVLDWACCKYWLVRQGDVSFIDGHYLTPDKKKVVYRSERLVNLPPNAGAAGMLLALKSMTGYHVYQTTPRQKGKTTYNIARLRGKETRVLHRLDIGASFQVKPGPGQKFFKVQYKTAKDMPMNEIILD